MRKMIVAKEGCSLLGVDQSSAHPRILSFLTQNEKFLKSLNEGVEETPDGLYVGEDFHSMNAILFGLNSEEDRLLAVKTQDKELIHKLSNGRKRGKGGTYACLPIDNTDVLTKDGWRRYDELSIGDEVLTLNTNSDTLEYNGIEKFHRFNNKKVTLIEKGKKLKIECTKDHRWFINNIINKKNGIELESCFKETKDLNTHSILVRGSKKANLKDIFDITNDECFLIGVILSDGSISWPYKNKSNLLGNKVNCTISQSDKKYIYEIKKLLNDIGCKFSVNKYDRRTCKEYRFRLNNKYIRDLLVRCGQNKPTKSSFDLNKLIMGLSREKIYHLICGFFLGDGNIEKGTMVITQKVGGILNDIITGCYLIGYSPSVYRRPCGKYARVYLNNKNYDRLQKAKYTNGRTTDVFCLTTSNSTFVIRQGDFITVTGNCLYGGSGKTVAKNIGVPIEEGEARKNAFLSGLGLDTLIDDLEEQFKNNKLGRGGSYIRVMGPYYIQCEYKHKLINTLAIGSEAVLQKKAIILLNRWLKENNLQRYIKLIANFHDELLVECNNKYIDLAKRYLEEVYELAAQDIGIDNNFRSVVKVGKNYAEVH